ncbi:MAG: sucrase ferredoxin [Cyanobacteria bacterium P01_G01_bin.49]
MKKSSQNMLNNCQLCAVISKSNGEDPIGSADTHEHWLAMEMEFPWSQERLQENPFIVQALALIHQKNESGVKISGHLMATDREYSQPGCTRFLYYYRPANLFATFEKQEFIVPNEEAQFFAIALLETLATSLQLTDWEKYRQQTSQIRELMVCTDGGVDLACGKFGSSIYQQLRSQYANEQLRVWRVNHFGGHQFAPTLLDWPSGQYWGHLSSKVLGILIKRDDVVRKLRPFYRGWSGMTKFEQIAEREIWMKEGWQWLDYQKTGRIFEIDEVNENWAELRIDFSDHKKNIQGVYEARIEADGFVMTAFNSQKEPLLKQVKQYRVSKLVKVPSHQEN